MLSEIQSAYQSITVLKDIIDASRDFRRYNELSSAVAEVRIKLDTALDIAESRRNDLVAAKEEIVQLKHEIVQLKNKRNQLDLYKLHTLPSGMFVRVLKEPKGIEEETRYACNKCFGDGDESLLQIVPRNRMTLYVCHRCGSQVFKYKITGS